MVYIGRKYEAFRGAACMGFWTNAKRLARFKVAENRAQEAAIYAQVVNELEQGFKDKGIWGKALVDSAGDETKAKARYLKLRAIAIADILNVQEDRLNTLEEKAQRRNQEEAKLREEKRLEYEEDQKHRREASELLEQERREKELQEALNLFLGVFIIIIVLGLIALKFT